MHHIHGGARKRLKFALLFCVNLCAFIISFLSSRLTSLDHICTTLLLGDALHCLSSIPHRDTRVKRHPVLPMA